MVKPEYMYHYLLETDMKSSVNRRLEIGVATKPSLVFCRHVAFSVNDLE